MKNIRALLITRLKEDDVALLAILLGVGLLSLFIAHWAIGLLFMVLSWWVISKLFARTFFTSAFSGLIFGFIVSIAAITACSALFWIVNNPLNLVQLGVVANLLLLGCVLVINWQGLKLPFKHSGLIDIKDLCALLVVAFSAGLYISSSYKVSQSFSPKIDALQNTTKALDDQNHFVMFRDTAVNDSGLLLGNNSIYKPNTLLSVYPKGAHTSAAVLAESGRGLWASGSRTAPGSADELYVYAFMKVLFYITTIYALTRFALELSSKMFGVKKIRKRFELSAGLMASVFCAYFTIIYLTPLFMDGAFSFIPIFMFAPIFILACSDIAAARLRLNLMLILGLIAAASTLMWTIGGVPYFILLAILVSRLVLAREAPSIVGSSIVVLLSTGLLGLVQIYVQLTSNVAVLSVNTAGGFYTFPLLLPLPFVAFVLWSGKHVAISSKEAREIYRYSLFIITVLLFICAHISLSNFKVAGEVQYYFTKLLYLPFILLTFLVIGIGIKILFTTDLFLARQAKQSATLSVVDALLARFAVVVLALSALFIAFPPNLSVVDYMLKGHRNISKSTASVLIRQLETMTKTNSESTFVLSDNAPIFENIMAIHVLSASNQGNYCQGLVFDAVYKQENLNVFTDQNIDECVREGTEKIKIFTATDSFDTLPNKFKDKINIEIIKF